MKIFKVLALVLAIATGISSCSKDDDVSSLKSNKYETTYVKMVITGGIEMKIELKTKAELEENDTYSVVGFQSDGVVYIDGENDGNWTKSGSVITILNTEGETITGTVDGDLIKVSITETEGDITSTIEMHFSKL